MSDCIPAPGDDWGDTYVELGYTWCQPCGEYHRPPRCALRPDGTIAHPWERGGAACG